MPPQINEKPPRKGGNRGAPITTIVNLREGELLVCPRQALSCSRAGLWNPLPIHLKKGTCVASFRKAIYSHFLSRYNDVDYFSLSL